MSSNWISKVKRTEILKRDNMVCCYCGKACEHYSERTNNYDYATLDHIVARIILAQSCTNDRHFRAELRNPHNLVTVCNGCNSSKKDTDLFVWCKQTGKNYASIIAEIARRIA